MRANYVVPFRRKREHKTDYAKRLRLLKSRTPRVVVRRSNYQMTIQLVEYNPVGDKILRTVVSSSLKADGWNHSFKSIPASYLAGVKAGLDFKGHAKKAVLDIGMHTPHKGSRLFAVLKGLVDAGFDVSHSDSVFPSEDRLSGKHISNDQVNKDFEKLKGKLMS